VNRTYVVKVTEEEDVEVAEIWRGAIWIGATQTCLTCPDDCPSKGNSIMTMVADYIDLMDSEAQ
jgi:hypothetical protein